MITLFFTFKFNISNSTEIQALSCFHKKSLNTFFFSDFCNVWSRLMNINNHIEPVHEISNNVVCATSKASDQPAHMRSLNRAFASGLSIL